jgi:hypothetical protein
VLTVDLFPSQVRPNSVSVRAVLTASGNTRHETHQTFQQRYGVLRFVRSILAQRYTSYIQFIVGFRGALGTY